MKSWTGDANDFQSVPQLLDECPWRFDEAESARCLGRNGKERLCCDRQDETVCERRAGELQRILTSEGEQRLLLASERVSDSFQATFTVSVPTNSAANCGSPPSRRSSITSRMLSRNSS